ncbi:MAG: hypothetical protein H7Y19_10515 [Luteimonas sp.]|nr:hypothetical protein [Luteimonas sp.]
MASVTAPPKPLARAVSILGHPLLVLPCSILLLAVDDGGDVRQLSRLAVGFAAFAMLVMSYSWWQVRRQRWAHVDASERGERRSLNLFLLLALAISAPLAWQAGLRDLALGLGLSAMMIAAALLSARWWTLSLHVAFVVFAAMLLLRAGALAAVLGLIFAALVAWSRLQLARHARRDLVAGAVAGAGAGLAFLQLSATVAT